MKINHRKFLYITEYDISIDNGPGINEREFVNILINNYCDEVICITPYPSHPDNHFDSRIEYVTNHREFSKLWYLVYLADTIIRVIKIRRRYSLAALVIRLGYTPLVPLSLSFFLKIPIILKTLAKYSAFSDQANWKGKILNKIFLPLYRAIIRKALFADTVSIPYIDWLHFTFGISKDRLALIPNGVNTEKFLPGDQITSRQKLNLNNFDHLIGYIGALSNYRNLKILFKSIKLIECKGSVGLILVGDGKDRTDLESLVQEEGIADRVVFSGQVSYELVPKYMQAFDIAVDLTVVAMKIGNNLFNSSYSQKIPQYLACGLPVTVCDVVDNQFIKKEKIGEVVTFGNVTQLAQSLSRLLSLDTKSKTLIRRRATNYAKTNLAIDILTAQRVKIWKSLVN